MRGIVMIEAKPGEVLPKSSAAPFAWQNRQAMEDACLLRAGVVKLAT